VDIADLPFRPFERYRLIVIDGDKVINGIPHLLRGSETNAAQGAPTENAEPTLDLIEPTGMRGRKVQAEVGMTCQPAIMLGLVGVEVVQQHMQLSAGISRHHLVHEG